MSEAISATPKSWKFGTGLLVAGLEALSAVALLGTSAYLISYASEQPPILFLMVAVVGVRAFALGRAAFRYLQRLLLHDAVLSHLATLRPLLFRKLVDQVPSADFSGRGDKLERLTTDVDELQNLGLRVMAPIVQAVIALLASFLVLLFFFPISSVAVLLLSSASLGLIYSITRYAIRFSETIRLSNKSKLRSNLVEQIEQVELLSHLGWLARYKSELARLENEIAVSERRSAKASGLATALLGLLAVLVAITSALLALAALAAGTAPNLLAVAVLLPLAVFDVFSAFQMAAVALIRYLAAENRVRALVEREPGEELLVVDGNLVLDRVQRLELKDTQLQLGSKTVQANLNIRLESGKLVALRGPSGQGKTTTALALSSLIRPVKGKLLINGFDADQFSIDSKRRSVVLVEQSPHVFAGTIRQNLEISGLTDSEKLNRALERVGMVEQFSERGGLEAEVSESAINISGGQAQRIAIARGLLANASYLILDEPTSGLDWENSRKLVALLKELVKGGVGVLVITHDAQLAELCDETIWLR